jgi:L-malate glycosyltransferase
MKVGITFAIDSLSRAGTETQLLALLNAIDRDRFAPSLVLLDGRAASSQALEPAGIPTLRLGITKLASLKALAAAQTLRRFWRQHPPSILQAYFLDSAYFAVPVARSMGVRRIVRVRNNLGYWQTRKHRLFAKLIAPQVRCTLTNCESGRQALIGEGMPAPKVQVLENGVDIDRFAPHAVPVPLHVGCVANLRAVKNIDGLVRAAAIVREQVPATFTVAGEGPERAKLEALRHSLNLQGSFHFPGAQSDIPQFLSQCQVAVLPSHSEGMSNAILEAMAAGRAIVATDVGENAKVLAGTGSIVPAGDDRALAAALVSLLTSPARCTALGTAARARAQSHYSREAMRLRFEAFYDRLARAA